VLLDLAMPGIGGLEALPLLRAVSPRAKVVVLSGLDPAEVEQRARDEGAAGYLVKGSDLSNLPRFLAAIAAEP
jgi:DNA-binding NarL/FixJ family response regulator